MNTEDSENEEEEEDGSESLPELQQILKRCHSTNNRKDPKKKKRKIHPQEAILESINTLAATFVVEDNSKYVDKAIQILEKKWQQKIGVGPAQKAIEHWVDNEKSARVFCNMSEEMQLAFFVKFQKKINREDNWAAYENIPQKAYVDLVLEGDDDIPLDSLPLGTDEWRLEIARRCEQLNKKMLLLKREIEAGLLQAKKGEKDASKEV